MVAVESCNKSIIRTLPIQFFIKGIDVSRPATFVVNISWSTFEIPNSVFMVVVVLAFYSADVLTRFTLENQALIIRVHPSQCYLAKGYKY